jgi:hypothetical protein
MNNKLEHIVLKYLNKFYGDLEKCRTDDYPDSVFFVKSKKAYMEYYLKNEKLYVDYNTIWSDLENTFSLEYNDIQSIIKKWMEVTYNLRGLTPLAHHFIKAIPDGSYLQFEGSNT